MTATATAPPDPESPPAPRRRRRRPSRAARRWLVLALVVAGVLLGWRLVGGQALGQTTVEISGAECTGGSPARMRTPSVVLTTTRDLRCTITATVHNRSGLDLHLGDVRGVVLGPQNAAVVRIETIDGSAPRDGLDAVDALHDLDRIVPAGSRTSFDVVVTFNPRACGTAGTMRFPGFPLIEASALGVGRTIGTEGRLVVRNSIEIERCLDSGVTSGNG